jgi:phosphoglycerate dehydrogenase-like enzyme
VRQRVLISDDQSERLRAPLAAEFPDVAFDAVLTPADAVPLCAEATAIISLAHTITAEMIAAAPKLRWIGALTTGTDHLRTLKIPDDVIITSARGLSATPVAEYTMMVMLAFVKRLPFVLANQRKSFWTHTRGNTLEGRTVTIVGAGAISEALAKRAGAFGMRVTGVSAGRTAVPGFDAVFPRERLAEAAATADFLVVLVPHTEATHQLIDARVLAAMKPSAYLINVARGGVIDAGALLEALRAGRIAGAALDVFAPEPMPADSPFWSLENVIVSPHTAGDAWEIYDLALPLMGTNLQAIIDNRPGDLLNVVAWKA